jgi:7-carboxy-7-deazaguanine synthase
LEAAISSASGAIPFRQNIRPLVEALLGKGLKVQLETNGTLWVDLPDVPALTIVCSPKSTFLHPSILPRITAYKYVLAEGNGAPDDGLPTVSTQKRQEKTRIARPPEGSEVYVMPLDEADSTRNEANRRYCVDIAKTFGYKLTLQTHKLLGID